MTDPVRYKDADDVTLDVAADAVTGFGRVQIVKPAFGGDGVATLVSAADPMPVGGTVDLSAGTLAALETINAVTGGLTDAQLRAAAVAISAASLPLPAGAATESTLANVLGRLPVSVNGSIPTQDAAYEPNGSKMLVGTARDRFFDNFNSFDTAEMWEVVATGAGMAINGPLGGAAAGSGPYLRLVSGTTAASKTILLSRSSFALPTEIRYQITASQRIANNRLFVGFVQVDDNGMIITDTTYSTAPEVLNARNAVMHMHDGTVVTTAQLRVRAAGSALDTFANAFGTGFTTLATGTTPNFLSATTYGLLAERDKINSRAWGMNVLTNTGGQFSYDRLLVNPTRRYKVCIILENVAAPATSTDWRLHLVNVMDAARFDVSPRVAGTTDGSKAFPVINVGGTSAVTLTSGTVTSVTTAGVPATPYFVNSLASTNLAVILTGTSGVTALWASNIGAGAAFVKLYNKATVAPVLATDIPEMIIPVPAAVSGVPGIANIAMGFNAFRFPLGLGIAITGGMADTDATAVAAGQVKVKISRTV